MCIVCIHMYTLPTHIYIYIYFYMYICVVNM